METPLPFAPTVESRIEIVQIIRFLCQMSFPLGILFIVSPTILKVLLLSDGGDLKVGEGDTGL